MTDAIVTQFATVAVCAEISPGNAGAEVTQMAIVAVCIEYYQPSPLIPFSVPGFLATTPYWIGEF